MNRQRFDQALIWIWPVLASLLSLYLSADYLISILLFLALPSIYLSLRKPEVVGKTAIFSAVVAIPVALIADSLFHATKTYVIHTTVFSFRVFDLFPIESFLWGFFFAYLAIMFYEYFLHEHTSNKLTYPRMKYLGALSVVLSLASVLIFKILPQNFSLGYAYMIIGSIFVLLPVAVELYEHPDVLKRMSLGGVYFFILSFLYELTALKLDLWTYYTEYTSFIGWLSVMGTRFPLEEVIFWFILLSFAVISLYDIWDDYPNR